MQAGGEPPQSVPVTQAEADFSAEAPGASAGELDFSGEGIGASGRARSRPLEAYDHDRHIDRMRAALALILVALVVLEVLIALVAVAAGRSAADMSSLLEKVLSPTVALAGSAVGFYFAGERDNRR
jgi:hypothetical protein